MEWLGLLIVETLGPFTLRVGDLICSVRVSVNVCVISDQFGLQPIFRLTHLVKSKQFDQNDFASNTTALMLTLSVNVPLEGGPVW